MRFLRNCYHYDIGLSQASMRMHRMGQAPLCRYGITLLRSLEYSHRDEVATKNKDKNQQSEPLSKAVSSTSTLEPPATTSSHAPPSEQKQPVTTSTNSSLPPFLLAYQRSCSKIVHHMGKVYDQCSEDFLNRFQK